jgi:hypothetical protein
MSVAMPTKGADVSVAGQKISWDAILIAAASVAGVLFLLKGGQPASADMGTGSSVDSGGSPIGTAVGGLGDPPPNPTTYHQGGGGGQPVGVGSNVSPSAISSTVPTGPSHTTSTAPPPSSGAPKTAVSGVGGHSGPGRYTPPLRLTPGVAAALAKAFPSKTQPLHTMAGGGTAKYS